MAKLVILVLVAATMLVSCTILGADERQQALSALAEMLAAGTITQSQYDALVAALSGGGWGEFLRIGGEVALGILGSLLGVRIWRGPIGARRGLASALASAVAQAQAQATTGRT